MDTITVHAILLQYGRWIENGELVSLVARSMNVKERQAYNLIKQARESRVKRLHIQRHIFPDRTVWYGLPDFGPPASNRGSRGLGSIGHSRIAIRRVKPYVEHPYRLLRLFESGEFDVLCPEFAGHLKSGYPNLYALFEKFRNLPESPKAPIMDEDEGWTTGEDETSPTKDIVNEIVNEVYWKLKHIVTQVENGRKLRGDCEYCSGARAMPTNDAATAINDAKLIIGASS